jgi:CheY-like chemotaxis protein
MLVFEVTDTGVGIPAESRERIFERFTQVDMSNARRYAGTGLGLAICRQLVEAMGGSIVCDARGEGPGTVFKVRLPAIKVDSPAAAVEPQITQPRLPEPEPSHVPEGNHHTAQPCLLVVEDNPVNQKVVMLMLERLGYRAEVANDGESALAAAQRRTYATILMDVRMPGMDGMEVTRRLRAGTGPNARTPVIAVTANALQAERDECMASGMNDFLSKPLILETLSARVAYWVGMGAHQPTQSSAHGDRAP